MVRFVRVLIETALEIARGSLGKAYVGVQGG